MTEAGAGRQAAPAGAARARASADSFGRARAIAVAVVLVLVAAAVFYLSTRTGGITWDEHLHRSGAELQFGVAGQWLAGEAATFRTIPSDLAFYGTVPIALATAADAVVVSVFGKAAGTLTFGMWIHFLAFLSYCVTGLVVWSTLNRIARTRVVPVVGTAFLMLFPLWLGYGLFDYKDMPTAALLVLVVYCAVRAIETSERGFAGWTALAVLATIFLGGTKAAALALAVVPWLAITIAALARRQWLLPPLAALGIVLGLVVITPASWPEPVAFFQEAVRLMSRHPWGGCMLTDGVCIGPQQEDWSAGSYLWQWALVQMPIVLLVGIVPATFVAAWRGGPSLVVAGTLWFAVAGIVVRNTTLYDGLRHVLFLMPLAVIVLFVGIDFVVARWGRPAAAIAIGLVVIETVTFVVDDVRMFPYNYSYFNLVARRDIDELRYDTDYWGFSGREVVAMARQKDAIVRPVVGDPEHLFAVGFRRPSSVLSRRELAEAAHRGPYTVFRISRGGQHPAEECETVAKVTRTLLWGKPLLLSFGERCEAG